MRKRLFVGFSTHDSEHKRGSWSLHDIELVKRDLLNHFHTRRGERVMMPTYGCLIWDYLFENLTDPIREIIIDDAERVVRSDSRVELHEIQVQEIEHGLIIRMTLFFKPWNVYENFSVEFDKRAQENI